MRLEWVFGLVAATLFMQFAFIRARKSGGLLEDRNEAGKGPDID